MTEILSAYHDMGRLHRLLRRLCPLFHLHLVPPVVIFVVILTTWCAPVEPAGAATAVGPHGHAARWVWPVDPAPTVIRAFEPPSEVWSAGHRGVDLEASLGQPILAIGAGTVSFAGPIAGRGVVVVDHGQLRSTYEPVTAAVHRGDVVTAGQPVGLLQGVGSHCAPDLCLHLGVREGAVYVDPLSLYRPRPVRLKPLTGVEDSRPGDNASGDNASGRAPSGGAALEIRSRTDGERLVSSHPLGPFLLAFG